MKVKFYASEIKNREKELAEAFGAGVRSLGDTFRVRATKKFEFDPDVDVACVFALKGASRKILETYRAAGKRTLLIDKGFVRASTGLGGPTGYYRIGLDEFMPLSRIKRMMHARPDRSRWLGLGMILQPLRMNRPDKSIIYCGSSQKYCDFHDLGNEHEYALKVIDEIRRHTDRLIYYRPKPSYLDARPIPETIFSRPPQMLGSMLLGAHALVTHGSHAGIDAIVGGVPAITLGPCAAKPVANHAIGRLSLDSLFFPDNEIRLNWLASIAWWQWTIGEMASGETWRWLRSEMEIPA